MQRYTIAILVRNQPGVLNRVTSLFRRRAFNIASLTVSETERPSASRITVLFDGDDRAKAQLVAQLEKLPDVMSIRELAGGDAVSRELLLIKMASDPATRQEIMDAASAFKANILDYGHDSMVIQLTGDTPRIDSFIAFMREYTILEICRTGVVSLERGAAAMGCAGA